MGENNVDQARAVDTADWDAIVIGSGPGGLCTAGYLATNGLRTLVLEQHDIVGGCTQVFRRKNRYEFDVGLHYLGDCQPGGVIPTVLRGLGLEGRIEFLPMDPDGHDTMLFPDFTFRMPVGWDRYLDRLVELFPDERRRLTRCVRALRDLAATLERVYAPRGRHPVWDLARRPAGLARLAWFGRLSLAQFLDRYQLSDKARAVLSAQTFYAGATPADTPVLTQVLLLWHYLSSGGYYPRGGGQVLAANLVAALRAHGGAVRTKARVEKILIAHGRVQGVRLDTGKIYRAPVVVSNADTKRTYLELVGAQHLKATTVKRATAWRMAAPAFVVYLGVDLDLSTVLRNTNYWLIPGYDPEALANPLANPLAADGESEPGRGDLLVWITSGTLKCPTGHALDAAGHSTMELMTTFPDDSAFRDVLDRPRIGDYRHDPGYLELKRKLTERVVQAVTSAFPGLADHIVWQETSTPLSHERYTLATAGSWAGIAMSHHQLVRRPRSTTEITGLFLTGASTLHGPGIVGTLRGGVATASAVLGRNLWKDIQAGRLLGDPTRVPPTTPGWDPFRASKGFTRKRGRTPRNHTTDAAGTAHAPSGVA